MRLRLDYRYAAFVTYEISIGGGYVRLDWKDGGLPPAAPVKKRPCMHICVKSIPTWKRLHPIVWFRNNSVMAMAWTAMHHLLEAARHRHYHEPIDIYLAAMWRQSLEKMGVPPKLVEDYVELTAEELKRSGILKKIKENRHAGRRVCNLRGSAPQDPREPVAEAQGATEAGQG